MSSWVEEEAREELRKLQEGREVWRDLKANIRQAVEDYTRIYSPTGIVELQYNDCTSINEHSIRVHAIPLASEESASYEITFYPDRGLVESNEAQLTFTVDIISESVGLRDSMGAPATLDQVSQAYLRPLIQKLPKRTPNILL